MLTARAIVADSADTAPDEVLAQSRAAGWDEAAIEAQRTRGWNMFQRMIFTLPRSYVRIADGETLDMGTHRWRVVTGSGHSPEHECLWHESAGVLVLVDQGLARIRNRKGDGSGKRVVGCVKHGGGSYRT